MSRAPFGYKIENKELIVDEEKKLIVPQIFFDFLNIYQLFQKINN
jgi:hypothetical protein